MLTWKGRRDQDVKTMIRVAARRREYRRKKWAREVRTAVKLPRTRLKVSRGVPGGKNGYSPQSQSAMLALCHFLGHVKK
jgi:hypothetical protein